MTKQENLKTIMDREKLSENPRCPACGKNFTLGESVVAACGDWGSQTKLVHEDDAVFDETNGCYVVNK